MNDEQMLVQRAQHDLREFATLYDRYADRIYAYAQRELGDMALAQDVRRQRPLSHPLPPAFKQRLRAQLLEEADMMHKVQLGSGIARWATGLAAAAEGGTFYGERLLAATAANGTVETIIDLPSTSTNADGTLKDDVVFTVEVIPFGSIPDESVGDGDNYAMLEVVGPAVPHKGDDKLLDVPLQILYKLTDYESASVIIGYNEVPLEVMAEPELIEVTVDYEGNVLDEGSLVEISQGEGTLNLVVAVPAELVNTDGIHNEDVGLWVSLKIVELLP
jgi:hypothetical protein